MQMFLWTAPTPDKDGDLDNGIIVHEYGHGISNRLVGGPSNVSCLTNTPAGGRGPLRLVGARLHRRGRRHRHRSGRGIGTYALNQPTTGVGIRTAALQHRPRRQHLDLRQHQRRGRPARRRLASGRRAPGRSTGRWSTSTASTRTSTTRPGNAGNQRDDALRQRGAEEHRSAAPPSRTSATASSRPPSTTTAARTSAACGRPSRPSAWARTRSAAGPTARSPTNGFNRARVLPGRRRHHRLHRRLRDEPGLDDEPGRHRHRDHRASGRAATRTTTTSSGTKQQGTTPSGVNALVDRPARRRVRRRQRHRRRRDDHPVAGHHPAGHAAR